MHLLTHTGTIRILCSYVRTLYRAGASSTYTVSFNYSSFLYSFNKSFYLLLTNGKPLFKQFIRPICVSWSAIKLCCTCWCMTRDLKVKNKKEMTVNPSVTKGQSMFSLGHCNQLLSHHAVQVIWNILPGKVNSSSLCWLHDSIYSIGRVGDLILILMFILHSSPTFHIRQTWIPMWILFYLKCNTR